MGEKRIIPYGKQTVLEEDIEAVVQVLRSDYLTQGPKLTEFENLVASYHGAKYAVAFANGTAALHGAYYAAGIETGDEIISSPITFAASTNGAIYLGGKPVFADISLETNCIDLEAIRDKITEKTKVITPVSLAGYPVDLKAVRNIADECGCCIIHDAAHAIGSKRDGSFGMDYADMAILSFHPVKHVTTGEGGMVLTNNVSIYEKLKLFRTHGITKDKSCLERNDGPWYYEMQELGFNYRMSDINAALGIKQFERIETNIKRRNQVAKYYNEEFENISELITPPGFDFDDKANIHAYHLYTLRVADPENRRPFYDYLHENGILAQIHYIPVTAQPYYRDAFGIKREDFPRAEEYYSSELSIPMFHGISDEEVEYVVEVINNYWRR